MNDVPALPKQTKPATVLLLTAAWLSGGPCWAVEPATPENTVETLPEISVTATREGELKSETPATVNILKMDTLQKRRPTHPKDLLNQVPGVWISNLSGEGHSTSIRQPLTTSAVYLYLEDGIPTRSTGFYNHNALYEINLPQAGGLEIVKGPGSALYGSDAIGGTVNALTRPPPRGDELEVTGETGVYGWGRLMVSGGSASENTAWRANLNLTHSDGWQDHSGYDRQTGSVRVDHALTDTSLLKMVFSVAEINQNHVGEMNQQDYDSNPRKNNTPISYRKVEAIRLSAAYERESAHSLLSITPYLRHNSMEIVPNWSLSYDPSKYKVQNDSFGILSKYRQDFAPYRSRLIVGLDGDYSPGFHEEDALKVGKTGTIYSSIIDSKRVYDYDVTYSSLSPYLQGEISPLAPLRLTAGLRFDMMRYQYDNRLSDAAIQGPAGAFPAGGWYGHAADGSTSYSHLSPKLGATYQFNDNLNGFVQYSNAFRTPSEGQVFRTARMNTAALANAVAQSQINLKPVTVDNMETGLRGKWHNIDYELSLYHMRKTDDIITYQNPVTNERSVVNTGETLHRGVETAVGIPINPTWRIDAGLSYAKHTYEKWTVSGTSDYTGKEMELAPRLITNTRVTLTPEFMNEGRIQAEWVKLGHYWRNANNTSEYPGHDLLHLHVQYPINKTWEVYGNINNLLDKTYAETSALSSGQPTYTVGLPRTMFMGVQVKW
ncbi:MAG: TonB-dependent receptor [Magnetococcales bacterium]|nr:TonB-dependent receptor [Magnetococcales bacterium]